MIVLIRRTPGDSWQGRAVDAPEGIPGAIWHGSKQKVKDSYRRCVKDEDITFIDFSEGWNVDED